MTPAAIMAAAARYVGTPYLQHGDTPAAWDCRGCVRHLRAELFGLQSPGMDPAEYTSLDARDLDTVERLMIDRKGLWRELASFGAEDAAARAATVSRLRPGAVLLFRVFDRDAHVGLLLTGRDFIHTLGGQETTIARVSEYRWSSRLRGAYDTDREP